MNRLRTLTALCAVALLFTATQAGAQDFRTVDDEDDWCESSSHKHDGYQVCEIREVELDRRSELRVDGRPNGGISVTAWDRDEILVRAKVTAHAEDASEARDLASRVSLSAGRTIEAEGPHTGSDEWFSVSYRVYAPDDVDVDLRSQNGGISIDGMNGRSRFKTQNGGVSLVSMSGDVAGETTNGGVTVDLVGSRWNGRGLDVETTNGGVSLTVPSGYSADLRTGTVNGRIKVDFPVMVEGQLDRSLNATLGEGGPPIRVTTTNGSVRIKRG